MVIIKSRRTSLSARLGLLSEWCEPKRWLKSLEITKAPFPANAADYDRAWGKFDLSHKKGLLALSCYYAEDGDSARVRGKEFLEETKDFFFGDWRNTYQTAGKTLDPKWWKQEVNWIAIFESSLLWGSVLGEWGYLKRVGGFPEPDISPELDGPPQVRDLYVALGAFLSEAPRAELDCKLDKVNAGKSKICDLQVDVVRACIARDAELLNKSMLAYLKQYKRAVFPKQMMTNKVSIFGTLFVHWAEKEKLAVDVPQEFLDHIVRV